MSMESPIDVMGSLMEKLKLDDPWIPPRSWDSVPSETGASSHSSQFVYPTSIVSIQSSMISSSQSSQGIIQLKTKELCNC